MREGRGWLCVLGVRVALSIQEPRKVTPNAPLTKLAPKEGEVLLQKDPLLDFLSIRDGSLVDCRNPLLDGRVDRLVFAADDFGDFGGLAAQFLAVLHSLWSEIVSWLSRFDIDIALQGKSQQVTSQC